LGAPGREAAGAVNDEKGRRIVMAEEIERLRNGAAAGCETVCPHIRGTVTQHCSLNFTLTDEEREAIETAVRWLEPYPQVADTLRSLLARIA
jgi:hypothetical protein